MIGTWLDLGKAIVLLSYGLVMYWLGYDRGRAR